MIVASGDNGNSAVGSYCDFVSDVVGTSEWVPWKAMESVGITVGITSELLAITEDVELC